jgi:hypothetical protein
MNAHNPPVIPIAVVLLLLFISAGCTSIPGPEKRYALPGTMTPVPEEVVTIKTMRLTTTLATTIPPTVIPAAEPSKGITETASPSQGTFESRSCAQQGGGIARPGQQCPGTWLIAVDTFSCCSAPPVNAGPRNASITIKPFDLTIVMNDDLGSILP